MQNIAMCNIKTTGKYIVAILHIVEIFRGDDGS